MQDVPKVKYHTKGEDDPRNINKKWWTAPEDKAHETIWPLVNYVRQSQSGRHRSNRRFYAFYNNESTQNLAVAKHLDNLSNHFGESAKLTFNVIKSCVDTARSKIAKQKPRPFFLTEDGDWHLQQKAKRLNQFILGLFDQMGSPNGLIRESLYTIGSEVFFDAAITGTGAAKMFIRKDKIVCERFLSDELVIDQFEGMYRTPRSMHQVKYIDREVLLDLYPEAKYRKAIMDAQSARTGQDSDTQDMIPVVESFHIRSGEKARDGRRTVTIETGTLKSVEWDKSYFPHLVQRWSLRPIGYFGIGLSEELQGIQKEINDTILNIQTGLRRVAVPRVFRHISDHNTGKKMSNKIGEYQYYREKPPFISTPQAFNAETYQHLDRLFSKAFEITGISQLSSMARKPAGLDSGVALRNYQDIESERFATVHSMYENFFTPQATYMALDLLDDLLEAGVDTVVQAKDGVTYRPIKYSEVKIPRDSFTVRPYPTAFLPSEPSGKFAKVQELVNAGMYDQDEARELLDFPDLKKTNRIKSAVKNACLAYVEKLVETGVYVPIDPYQDLKLTRELAQSYYLEGRTNGLPDDRLDLLRRILEEIRTKEQKIEEAQMQKQMAMQQAAMAAQAPPPVQEQDQTPIGPEGIA